MEDSIQFFGAAKTVTGSSFLLNISNKNILIDCGMFQGPDVYSKNYEDFQFDPKLIDYVLLSHAHIDHSGLLPKLYVNGYEGNVYCTHPTKDILQYILPDSAKVQENNLKFQNIKPIYTSYDVSKTLKNIRSLAFDEILNLDGTIIIFRRSSHILGASSIEIHEKDRYYLFSGDLGRKNPTIIKSYENITTNPNYIIMESLYGNKKHPSIDTSIQSLISTINKTIQNGGNAIIPVFALHRAQEIIHILLEAKEKKLIDQNIPIYFDSPLGEKILRLYSQSIDNHNEEFRKKTDPFGFKNKIRFIKNSKESLNLKKKRKSIILAGGGMLDGGRIINHLFAFAKDKNSTLIIVGFQAEGTLGRTIISRPKNIKINKHSIPLNIQIEEIYGFSAHADQDDLLWWINWTGVDKLNRIFLVHSEPEQSESFVDFVPKSIKNKMYIPSLNEKQILE